jgi:hypothetical protein
MRRGQAIKVRFLLLFLLATLLLAAQSYGMATAGGHCHVNAQAGISAEAQMPTTCSDADMDPAQSDCAQHLCSGAVVVLSNASVQPIQPMSTPLRASIDITPPLCFTQIIYRPPRV